MREKTFVKRKFQKKSHNAEKTERGNFWDFSTSIVSKNIKKLRGWTLWGNFFFERKITLLKKLIEGPFSRSRYSMLRGKRGKTFLVQFAMPK